jgi:hypothetical protein
VGMLAACWGDMKKTSGWSGTCESHSTRRSLCSHNAAELGRRKVLRAARELDSDCRLLVGQLICLFKQPNLCPAMRWLLSWLPFLGGLWMEPRKRWQVLRALVSVARLWRAVSEPGAALPWRVHACYSGGCPRRGLGCELQPGYLFQVLVHETTEASVRDATRFSRRHLMIHDTSRGREGDVQALSVSIQAAPLIDPVQREAFRRFSIDLAAETNSFYAEADDEEATYGTAARQKRRPSVLGTPLITKRPVPENGWGCPSGRNGGHP